MFTCENIGGRLAVFLNGAPFLKVSVLTAVLQDGREVTMKPDKTVRMNPNLLEIPFRAADESVSACLSVRAGDRLLEVWLDASAAVSTPAFARQPSFHLDRGLRLSMECGLGPRESLAVYQHKGWWMRPQFVLSDNLPDRTQMLLTRQEDCFLSFVALCGADYRSDLASSGDSLTVTCSSNRYGLVQCHTPLFTVSCSTDPYQAIHESVHSGLSQRGLGGKLRTEKQYPEMFRYLGWCSWDAFYQQVNEDGMLQKAEEFRQKAIPVKWMLIDDGWHSLDGQKLYGWDADTGKFPGGLSRAIGRLKRDYGISQVGVWYALPGYWEGISPDGPVYREVGEHLMVTAGGKCLPRPEPQHAKAFYDAFHQRLRQQGVDFVKVDSQSSSANLLEGAYSYGAGSSGYLSALEASADEFFGGAGIHCMGMAPQDIWGRKTAAISRSSDDFVPEQEDSFEEHALQNAYTSLWHGELYWGDWDMYWSDHVNQKQNALLRAVSGGPVYLSDPVGNSDPAWILPMACSDGRLLQCDAAAVPAKECLLLDVRTGKHILKLTNTAGNSTVLGAFHISKHQQVLDYQVGWVDAAGNPDEPVLSYHWFQKDVDLLEPGDCVTKRLEPKEAGLHILLPAGRPVTAIGLTDKFISPAAVREEHCEDGCLSVLLQDGGEFAFYTRHSVLSAVSGEVSLPVRKSRFNQNLYFAAVPSGSPVRVEIYYHVENTIVSERQGKHEAAI